MGGKSSPVVGYRHRLTVLAHLCANRIDRLLAVRFDKRTAWIGPASDGEQIVDAPQLFGGDEREGGVAGRFDIMPGGPTQGVNAYLRDTIGLDPLPAFRWVTSVLFKDFYFGNNPYLKPFSFIFTAGRLDNDGFDWYPETADIPGDFIGLPDGQIDTIDNDPVQPAIGPLPNGPVEHRELFNSAVGGATPGVVVDDETRDGILFTPGVDGYYINSNGTSFQNGTTGFQIDFSRVPGQGIEPVEIRGTCEFAIDAGGVTQGVASIQVGDPAADVTSPAGPQNWQLLQSGWRTLPANTETTSVLFVGGRGASFRDLRVELRGDFGVIAIDRNPAHVARLALTDTALGRGVSNIDDASFRAAADLYYAEGLGVSYGWDMNEVSPEDVAKECMAAAQSALFTDRRTGLYRITPIRDIEDPSGLPLFTDADIISLDLVREDRNSLPNQLYIKYWDWSRYGVGTFPVTRPAAFRSTGEVNAENDLNFPLIRKRSTAERIATRELTALSTPKYRGKITLTRAADGLNEADAFRLQSTFHDIPETVFRVTEIDEGDGAQSRIIVDAVEQVFTDGGASLISVDSGLERISGRREAPAAVTDRVVQEAPYYEIAQEVGDATAEEELELNPTLGFLHVAAAPGSSGQISARVEADAGAGFISVATANYVPSARLVGPLSVSPQPATVTYTNGYLLGEASAGDLVQVGAEIMRLDAIDTSAATLTLARGCLDTVPIAHAAGSPVLLWADIATRVSEEYAAGESVSVRLIALTGRAELAVSAAPVDVVTMNQRGARPYRPANLQLAAQYAPIESYQLQEGDVLSWSHQNRLTQTEPSPADFLSSDIGPEIGVTYRIEAIGLDSANTELAAAHYTTTQAANTLALSLVQVANPAPPGAVRLLFRVYSVRDGLDSWVAAEIVCANPGAVATSAILLSGDAQTGSDRLALSGDTGVILISETS